MLLYLISNIWEVGPPEPCFRLEILTSMIYKVYISEAVAVKPLGVQNLAKAFVCLCKNVYSFKSYTVLLWKKIQNQHLNKIR